MPTATNNDLERRELAALLDSGIFNRAPSLAQLLTYICQKHFDGQGSFIKEYNIAVEALGRTAEFDQKRDSIVRVEAHRLRKRLKEYYEGAGSDHQIRIAIPPGQYAPKFIYQNETSTQMVPAPSPAVHELLPPPSHQQLETIQNQPREFTAAKPRQLNASAAILLVTVATALVAGTFVIVSRPTPLASPAIAGAMTLPLEPGSAIPAEEIRILAGSSKAYVDRFGRTWQKDAFFEGGTVMATPNHTIWGTGDARIYQSRREGAFSYAIPLKPGPHELRLHFAEVIYGEANIAGGGESSRLFNVRVNGKPAINELDLVADAGPSTADVRVLKDIYPAKDGLLHLEFDPITSLPILNAIEITPGIPGKLRPIRIVAREQTYTDKDGQSWQQDRYYRGGQLVLRPPGAVSGAKDPEIYRGERYGNLTYSIPVAPGRYGLILHFAEAWFGPDKPTRGGIGSRIFDILCNGVALARSFDIYKEAGGSDRALVKTFHGLDPNTQGKLCISMVPIRNYGCVNAIEVIDETP